MRSVYGLLSSLYLIFVLGSFAFFANPIDMAESSDATHKMKRNENEIFIKQ